MRWQQFVSALDDFRARIRANRNLKGEMVARDPILNELRDLADGVVDPNNAASIDPVLEIPGKPLEQPPKKEYTGDGTMTTIPRENKPKVTPPDVVEATEETVED